MSGDAVTRTDELRLWETVDAVAHAVGTQPPDNIVLGLTPEMFVTQAPVRLPSGPLTGRTLYMSLPLIRLLDQAELRAIIGHELGHFYGQDLEVSTRFYPVYRRAIASFRLVTGASRSEAIARVTLASAVGTLRYFLLSLSTAEIAMARDRELLADRAGTHVSSPQAMASALVKVSIYAPVCDRLLQSLPDAAPGTNALEGTGDQLSRAAAAAEHAARPDDLGAAQLAHPIGTLPPLEVRLEALGTTARAVLSGGLSVKEAPATDLIPDAAARDLALTSRYMQASSQRSPTARSLRRPASTGDATIDASWTHPAVSRAVEFLRAARGGSLAWILLPKGQWVTIDDLLIGRQLAPLGFRAVAGSSKGAAGERWQVLDLADSDSPADEVLRSGTRLNLVGVVNRGITASTMDEIVFSPANGRQVGRLVSVGLVGRSPVHLGLAGSLIVPGGDSLISNQTRKSELLDLIETALDEVDGIEP
jgi:Zn-dependent protease with chaperone function